MPWRVPLSLFSSYFIDNAWLDGHAEDVADSLKGAFTTLPSSDSFFLYYSMAPLRPLPDMAFDIQTEHYTAGYIIARSSDVSRTDGLGAPAVLTVTSDLDDGRREMRTVAQRSIRLHREQR
jgi:hypothetical protein